MPPMHADKEIMENSIDSDSSESDEEFSKELPYESEYYRTSTDRSAFVRPIPGPEENEIDDGEGGIDLDDMGTWDQTPDCTYHIFIQQYFEAIDHLDIKLDGLTVKSTAKSNLSPDEFIRDAQKKVFDDIKGKTLSNELVNEVVENLRKQFADTYGYADYCGVSTNVVTYFMKNVTQMHETSTYESTDSTTTAGTVDTDSSTQIEAEHLSTVDSRTETATATETTAATTGTATTGTATTGIATTGTMTMGTETTGTVTTGIATTGTQTMGTESQTGMSTVELTTSDEFDGSTTEKYQPRVLKRPKLPTVVQDSINFYKALHHWKFTPSY